MGQTDPKGYRWSPFLTISVVHLQPIPKNTAFFFFFLFKLLFMGFREGGEGTDCEDTQASIKPDLCCPCVVAAGLPFLPPLVLCHAALCRLASPNFCLKLNLKEKKRDTGSLSSWTFLFCQRRREGLAQMGQLSEPLFLVVWARGKGKGPGLKPAVCSLFWQKQNHRHSA